MKGSLGTQFGADLGLFRSNLGPYDQQLRPPSVDWAAGVASCGFEYLERDEVGHRPPLEALNSS